MSFTESIVEDAALSWFGDLDYSVLHGQDIAPGEAAAERASFAEAFLPDRLRAALRKLNPKLPAEALDDAYRKITIPTGPNLTVQNRAFHRMLVDGIAVECRVPAGPPSPTGRGSKGEGEADHTTRISHEIVRLIDFGDPEANDWLAVNQFTVIEGQHNPACAAERSGAAGRRRPDVVIFINGLPLGVIELKNAADENADIWQAFAQFQTYKQQIPSLFVHNAVLVISDGLEARIGTISADKERFMPWRTIEGETVAPAALTQLEVLLRGVFDQRRFLDHILAGTGALGFGAPRLCIQVKSQDSPVGRPEIDQLMGAMKKVNATEGLFVSWSGFKANVQKDVSPSFFTVRLWTQKELLEQLFAHYDHLDEDLKAELPLKRIWTVAAQEDE